MRRHVLRRISRRTASKRRAVPVILIFAPAGSLAIGPRTAAGLPRLVSSDAYDAPDCLHRCRTDVVGIFPNPTQSFHSSAQSSPREVSAIEAAA